MSAVTAVQTDTFEKMVLQADKPVLVDFWATWCGPCRMLAPLVEELSEAYAGKAEVYKVDVDTNPDLAMRYGVSSIPTLLLFHKGEVVEKTVGVQPRNTLQAMLDRVV